MSETVPARILVIDDEPQIRRFLDISLRAQGYVVLAAATADEGLAHLATDGADVVILDLGLPDRDGVEVLRDLRQWSSVPVLVLTARGDEDEKVKLLDAGANDYVTKPFGIRELMARLRALRRMQATADGEPAVYDDGELRIDPVRREVLRGGVALSLTRKEYALLTLLVRHAGRVVTQPQLLREVWEIGRAHV